MKKIAEILCAVSIFINSCATLEPAPKELGVPARSETPRVEVTKTAAPAKPKLPLSATWQIQYSGEMDYSLDVNIYNLDLFDTDATTIAQLHQRGVFVMCYFSAGSFEDWRTDAQKFPQKTLGKAMEGWAGEKWLDIRQIELLKPVIESRLNLAAQKNCDGVDPDNVDGYANDTGFPLSAHDQLAFNIFLSTQAHTRGLSIGLKNDLEQIPDLLPFFDWALNEECFYYKECRLLLPFVNAGKPVFVIEYNLPPAEFCAQANALNFNALQKKTELDKFYFPCR
jgi:hypothetical protein